MRSPSGKVCRNSVDYYAGTTITDVDGGPQYAYPPTPTVPGVRCSAQPDVPEEMVDDQMRVTQVIPRWTLLFPSSSRLSVKARDQFLYLDDAGIVHTLYARHGRDAGGRASTFRIDCVEKV